MSLKETDPIIKAFIDEELKRQNDGLELIASENWVSPAVREAVGSVLTNKYAEGYPGNRYYGGCENIDAIEQIAIDRCKKLFNCDHANVQPHSGANANLAAYYAVLNPGDKILGMALSQGGHLTHGTTVNYSGKFYKYYNYGVDEKGHINYREIETIMMKKAPRILVAGASAHSRIIDFERMAEIAHLYNAILMADISHIAGLVATGLHPSPFPYADIVTSTTHKTLRGPRGGLLMWTNNMDKTYNFNKAVFPGVQGGPLEHVIAGKAVCFKEAMSIDFVEYQQNVLLNAKIMESVFDKMGIPMVSGGTSNHLIIIDTFTKHHKTGAEVEMMLEKAGITVNKNMIPNDTFPPSKTSGIRIGTPDITTRGLDKFEVELLAKSIADIIISGEDAIYKASVNVRDITNIRPLV